MLPITYSMIRYRLLRLLGYEPSPSSLGAGGRQSVKINIYFRNQWKISFNDNGLTTDHRKLAYVLAIQDSVMLLLSTL